MRAIGFSTGALARGDVARGADMLRACERASAIELSALRFEELEPLVRVANDLELSSFAHVSVHAPSRFASADEPGVVRLLTMLPPEWPIVLHPDAIHDAARWESLSPRVLIENMDSRKRTGRTVEELEPFFAAFPRAGFCLDVAHAREIGDGTSVIDALLDAFADRLVQLHVSALAEGGDHEPVSEDAARDFERVSARIPATAAIVIESVISPASLRTELLRVGRIFSAF